jgi:hypothetical protein
VVFAAGLSRNGNAGGRQRRFLGKTALNTARNYGKECGDEIMLNRKMSFICVVPGARCFCCAVPVLLAAGGEETTPATPAPTRKTIEITNNLTGGRRIPSEGKRFYPKTTL